LRENYSEQPCAICKQRLYCTTLHGENGGPYCCLTCIGKWNAEHGRKRRLGRIAIRALHAFLEAGGRVSDLNKLTAAAMSGSAHIAAFFPDFSDQLGYMTGVAGLSDEQIDLTPQLIDDAIKLTHPDAHPPERRELATQTSQALLALKPYVFPAPAPKAPRKHDSDVTANRSPRTKPSESRDMYPCAECRSTISYYYCDRCRTRWESNNEKEREQAAAKQRDYRERRRMRFAIICANCKKVASGKRKDAIYCSDKCRQAAHRKAAA
jgi:hypothetical protein